MRKLKSKVEICKLPSTTPVFLLRYREVCKLLPNPHWSPLQGIPCKGQALDRVTPWITPGFPHAQVGLRCAFWQVSPGPLPVVFTIKLSGRNVTDLVPSGTRWQSHHKHGWCDLARLQAPPMYKHRVVRGMQTLLNTRPKPRASA